VCISDIYKKNTENVVNTPEKSKIPGIKFATTWKSIKPKLKKTPNESGDTVLPLLYWTTDTPVEWIEQVYDQDV
jgi:hypothetical protein